MKPTTLSAALAAIFATTTAMAAVNNLESYLFRFDFSKGANEFSSSPSYTGFNFVGANTAPTNGPNGVSSAATITANAWKAFTSGSVLNEDGWTIATSLSVANVNNACVFSVGRLTTPNTGGAKKTLAICTTDATDRLLVRFVYRTSSGYSCTEKVMSGLGDITRGFHTLIIKYEYTDNGSGNKGTLTLYWDGENKMTHVFQNSTPFGTTDTQSVGGIQFNNLTSQGAGTFGGKTFVNAIGVHSFYDFRFYKGQFNDSDARAYAALYPCTYPFRPSAYVESSATNTTANATIGNYIDTGYLAKGATTRFAADFQFLDVRGQQRIFGARGTFVQGLYIRGSDASGGNLAWNFMGTDKWVNSGKVADRLRRIATFDRVGKTVAVTNYDDRAQFYYNNNQADFLKDTSDADTNTYLFAENFDGAKCCGKARIYSFEADEDGTPVLFLAPDMENGEAGFRNIIDGSFKGDGNKDNSPERTLRFSDGVGCASDYKYEDNTLYAKLYATSEEKGTVSVAEGEASASAEGWVPHGGTLALSAVASDSSKYEFGEWTGDTWAIADGYSVSNASIEVSTPYAVQLHATFKPAVNAQLTIAADGASAVNWSAADWRSAEDASVAISAPIDKEVTVVAHKSVTLTLDANVSLSKFTVQADANCVVTFTLGSGGTFCADEVVVSNGVFKLGSDDILGATPLVTVEDGGTFDFNGKVVGDGEAVAGNVVTEFHIAGAGAGDWPWAITSSADMTSSKNVCMLHLDADATVGGAKELWMGVRNGAGWNAANKNLNLNGFTLTKTGTGTLQVRRPYSRDEGTIDVQSGSVRVTGWSNATAAYGESCVSNVALVVREGTTAESSVGYPLYFKTLDCSGGALTGSSGGFGMSAGETFAGHGTAVELTMADGAVATIDGNLDVTTTLTAEGALSLARKTGVETNVTVFVPGTFATVSGNTVTVGEGVILDLGVSRPAATLAADAAATLVLRLTAYDEAPVLNVSANPAQLIVYKLDGVTDITSGCTIEYDAEAGTITITPPVPVWTNADGTGSFESAANWDSGEVPADGSSICVSNATDVAIAVSSAHAYEYVSVKGGATLSFNGSGSLTVGALAFYDGTELKTGGVVVPAAFNGTGDLVVESGNGAGYSITGASTLTGKLTIKATASFTNTFSAAVNVTNMTVDADANVVVTMVKGSGGSFYANEVVVSSGVLQQGSANALGNTPKITVQDGGTFDINAKAIRQETPIYIAGAGAGNWPWALASSSGAMASGNYLFDLYLTTNATVGAGQLKLGRSDANSFIYLNGYTLTAKSWMTLRYINTMEGTLDLQAGATFNAKYNLNRQTAYRGTTLIVHEGFTYSNKADEEVDVSYLEMYGGTIGYDGTARDFGVWNELHGYGVIKRLVMGTGAKYYPDGENYLNVTEKLSGKLKIDICDPTVAGKLDPSLKGKIKIPLLKVPADLKDTADAAFDLTALPPGWELKSEESGEEGNRYVEYWLKNRRFTIFIR